MIKIDVGRNDKCLCGSNLKFKNCCLKNKTTFSFITDLDFIFIEEYDRSINDDLKSTSYWETLYAITDLKTLCENYKRKLLGSIKYEKYQDISFKYIFKHSLKENGESNLFICNIIELPMNVNLEDNLLGAGFVIGKLKECLIPESVLNPDVKVEKNNDIETYMI